MRTNFDANLQTISKQLEVLQKSLQKREKAIKKTIRDKDKVTTAVCIYIQSQQIKVFMINVKNTIET